jgi:hypothetical protein
MVAKLNEHDEVDYSRWSLRDRLELLASEAELVELPRPLITALWEAIELLACLGRPTCR